LISLSDSSHVASKMSWLSAKLVIIDQQDSEVEYDMDSFLEEFRMYSNQVPTLTILFLCWCAQYRRWFSSNAIVQFHIIDHNGENQMLTLGVDNRSLVLRDHKIYHQFNPASKESPNAYTYYHPC